MNSSGKVSGILFYLIFSFLSLLLLLFVLVPLSKMIFSTSPVSLWETFLDKEVRDSIVLTILAALYSTIIAFVTGVPLAYLLVRKDFPGKSFVEALIDIPIIIPHVAAGIALLFVFGRRFAVGSFFDSIGIRFVHHIPGIVIAMLFVSLPYLVNAAKEGFRNVDVRLEYVARSLGAGPWTVFWKINFPLASGNILSGSIMMWARGISEFGAIVILTYHPMTASILTFERFQSFGLDYSRPVAVLLILICLVIFGSLRIMAARSFFNRSQGANR
jgi:molybdate/tungstate transport system permease protein